MSTEHRIRRNVFETNSSSSHAAHLGPADVYDMTFEPEQLRSGYVEINTGSNYFSDEEMRYYRPENILGYMVCDLFRGPVEMDQEFLSRHEGKGEFDIMPLLIAQNDTVKTVFEKIKEECGVELRLVMPRKEFGYYFDVDDETSIKFDYKDWSKMKNLLFNSQSYIETKSRDVDFYREYDENEGDDDFGRMIYTDLGVMESTIKPGQYRLEIHGRGLSI